jgi:RecB family exonuclease
VLPENHESMIKSNLIPPFKLLERISPSQYFSATQCRYKLILAYAFAFKQLTPTSPNAYLGSVLHKMIELISKRVIQNDEDFEDNWRALIEEKEATLKKEGLTAMTPLKYFCEDFALKKLRIKAMIKKQPVFTKKNTDFKKTHFSEEKLFNQDKSISGVVDLLIINDDGAVLLDFKTGSIYEDSLNENGEQDLKKDYEYQLKLYAYLCYLKKGIFPKKLFIVTIENAYIEISSTFDECEKIYTGALLFLKELNEAIINRDELKLANCSIENCKFCGYRPACSVYGEWFKINYAETRDLMGTMVKMNVFENNTIGIEMIVANQKVLINGFCLFEKEDLINKINQELNIYNVKKSKSSVNGTANYYTVIYA